MKTFKTIMITVVITMAVTMIGVGAFLFKEGVLTIEKRDIEHNKTVIVDGVLTEETTWKELMGYKVQINVVDEAYIGR